MEPLLEAEGLAFSYESVDALRGLSLTVSPGELYGLVGPDGAGKTTALRLAAGLMLPSAGRVRMGGRDPADTGSGVRERLGYMPQQYSLYGDLTVAENLRFFADLFCLGREQLRERSERLLRISRLGGFQDRRADALSGGMYKKLALSCALLHEPDLLVLDEPTNGVDPVSRIELWDLLHEFVSAGMAVIVSTPYMDEAERCRRVGLLHSGRLLLEGAPTELLERFEHVVLRLSAAPEATEELLEERAAEVIGVAPQGDGLRIVARRESAADLEAALRDGGAALDRARPTFEDLFLAAVDLADGEGEA